MIKKFKPVKKIEFKRAEHFIKEYRKTKGSERRAKRVLSRYTNNNQSKEANQNIVFVIRCRGDFLDKKTKKFLKIFRLNRINTGIFLKLTPNNEKILKVIEPCVAYGTPNLKSIQELILKRGYARINNEKVPITDNKLIEDNLGSLGIICVEDIIHEINTCGPNFFAVCKFLSAFQLSKHQKKRAIAIEDFKLSPGNHSEKINEIIQSYT